MRNVLTIDVGGTFTKYALIRDDLKFLDEGKIPTVTTTLDAYIESLADIYARYRDMAEGVAFSMPGVIDPASGFFFTGGSLDHIIHELSLKEILSERLKTNISIGNDAKCAAYAEIGFGSLTGIREAVMFILGTAVGGCLIHDGQVIHGAHFAAGEFSYINTDGDDISIDNVLALRLGSSGLKSLARSELKPNEDLSGLQIFSMADSGDVRMQKAIHRFAYRCAVQIYNLQAIFDPDAFAIGGGISCQPRLFDEIQKSFEEIMAALPMKLRMPKVIPCKFFNNANLIGALYKYIQDHPV